MITARGLTGWSLARALAGLALAGSCALASGCALAPVETDRDAAAARAAAMAADCNTRGGVWNRERGVCLGAEPPGGPGGR